jgi:hypothetical protein
MVGEIGQKRLPLVRDGKTAVHSDLSHFPKGADNGKPEVTGDQIGGGAFF